MRCTARESTQKRRHEGRELLGKERRILGRDHRDTLITSGNLAASLSKPGKHAGVTVVGCEVLFQKTILFGAEHDQTMLSVSNLAVRSRSAAKRQRRCSSSATL